MHNYEVVGTSELAGAAGTLDRGWLQDALHDLCQPLTALQCRLFLGTLSVQDGDQPACAEALQQSLTQCERVMEHVRTMQQHLLTGGGR